MTALPTGPAVHIRVPADAAFVAPLRTAAAAAAVRADLTVDDIEDLRIAVDEACALLLRRAASGADLTCDLTLAPGRVLVAVSVPATDPRPPAATDVGWLVLTALTRDAEAHTADGRLTLRLVCDRDGGR